MRRYTYTNRKKRQIGGRNLPSIIKAEHLLFKNVSNKYVELPRIFQIIFDSGNQPQTMIGKGVVERLGLVPEAKCIKEIHGVGGAEFCYRSVTLDIRFIYPYNTPGDNRTPEYQNILVDAMVSEDQSFNNTVLFGHDGGLNQLFALGYAIDALYHTDHPAYLTQFVRHEAVDPKTKEGQDFYDFLIGFQDLFPNKKRLNDVNLIINYFSDPVYRLVLIDVLRYFVTHEKQFNPTIIKNHKIRTHIIQALSELYLILIMNQDLLVQINRTADIVIYQNLKILFENTITASRFFPVF